MLIWLCRAISRTACSTLALAGFLSPFLRVEAQLVCTVETLQPATLASVTLSVNRAIQTDPVQAPRVLREAMRELGDVKKFTGNLVGAGFLKAQIYVLWMHQAGTKETMTLEQLGASVPKGQGGQSVDLAQSADSLLRAVEAAGPACRDLTLQWRQSKPWTERINKAYTYLGAGNIDSASYWADRAALLFATSPFVHNIYAQLASAKGDTPTMLARLRLAVAEAAKDTSLAETEKQLRFQLATTAQTYAMTGGTAQKGELNSEALAIFQGLLERYPATMDGTYAFSAGSEIVKMQSDSALTRKFLAPLTSAPTRFTDLTLLLGAELARAAGRSADAIALYEGALAKNANIRDANYFLAYLYYEAKQPEKMLPLTDRLIGIDPSNGDNYLMKAYAYSLLTSAEKNPKKKGEYQRMQDSLFAEEGKLAAAHKMQIKRFERRQQGAALGGAVENLSKVSRPFTVTVDFLDASGAVLETMTAAVPETAPGARGEFALEPKTPGIVAFRYTPLGTEGARTLAKAESDLARTSRTSERSGELPNPSSTSRTTASASARDVVRAPPRLILSEWTFTDSDGDRRLTAGERATIRLKVRNDGAGSAQGVQVVGTSELAIRGLQANLGMVSPGEMRDVTLSILGGESLPDSSTALLLEVKEANGFDAPTPLRVSIKTQRFRPPMLGIAEVAVQDAKGRSIIEIGQVVTITVRVRNTGEGSAEEVRAVIRAGENVFLVNDNNKAITRGIGPIESGGHRDISFDAFANNIARSFPLTVELSEPTQRFSVAPKDLGLALLTPQRSVAQLDVEPTVRNLPLARPPVVALTSELLRNVPIAPVRNPDAIAIIIGNRSYSKAPEVAFAANDAAVVRLYAERTLGIQPGNIVELLNASGNEFNAHFGVKGNPNGLVRDMVKPGVSEVFVFYSGHGAPDPRAERAYLMPVDADPNRLDLTAYSLDVLYQNLSALGAKHVTVVLDACFSGGTASGGMLIASASPIGIKVDDPSALFTQGGGATIVAAARGQELANWYPEQRHGLLTYFFLKGLQGAADANRDSRITLGELSDWLSDPTRGVPYESRRMYGTNRQQTPQVFGSRDRVIRP